MAFLRKQESRLLMLPKRRSPGPAFGQAGLSRLGGAELFHSAKVLQIVNGNAVFYPNRL